jgi:cell fate (sporulation/competence/biofilm development) regulator YlbF (YheA/YmcA/DUF963 family)
MPDTADILTKARALGEALAAHPVVQAHSQSQRAAREDRGAQQLLRDYQAQLTRIRQLESELKPIEVEDKRKLKDLEARMAGCDSLKNLMRTQADYVALMSQVNNAIDAPVATLGRTEPPK